MKVAIRHAVKDDVEKLTAIYNHYVEHTPITFDLEVKSVAQRMQWFEQFALTGRYQLLVAEQGNELLGYANSSQYRVKAAYQSSVESTIYLHQECHAKGVGSALYAALFEQLSKEDVHRVFAGVTLPNDASLGLHRKFGFTPIGTFGEVGYKFEKYWDVAWFEKPL